ncbi:STAS domain-containing protein [Micromonospora sp. NPDC005174]|uniref:STAS domain-containing protein n=1 Tax=unclassified Micromonospora TaxID=2617518 RepID=UPI0033AE6199
MEERSDRIDVQVSVGDQVVQVRVTGEVDIATVAAFRSALWSAPARPVVQLELSGLRLLSAAGVRTLLAAHLRVRARGGELVVVDPTPVVARVLRATGLHRVMPILEPARVVEAARRGAPADLVAPVRRPPAATGDLVLAA